MKRFGYSFLPLFLLGVLVSGCDTRTPVAVHFNPDGNGPLTSIKASTILIQVEDLRPAAERDSVYQIVADVGGTQTFYTKKPVPLIVQDALVSELAKCGHRAVTDPGAPVDARVKIGLERFRAFLSTTTLHYTMEGQIDAEISVTNDAKKTTAGPFRISGNYQRKSSSHQVYPPEKELSAALAEFVHNLAFDSRFAEALQ
jgi:uncharacterized lipoprotein YajG